MEVDEIAARIEKLEDKLKDKKKDRWDVIAIIGGIITPVMIGIATIAVTTVQIYTSNKTDLAELASAVQIADAQITVAKTNSLVQQGKLVPELMNALLDKSDPAKRSLAIKTIEESLPDIGKKVLEAAIEVDPSIENELFGADIRASIDFWLSTEDVVIPKERLFESDGILTIAALNECENPRWHLLGACKSPLSIRSATSSTNIGRVVTVDDEQFKQSISFEGFTGDIGEAYRRLNDPETKLSVVFTSRSPIGSNTDVFLASTLDTSEVTRSESRFRCFYGITDADHERLSGGDFGDFSYVGYPVDASLKVYSRGQAIRELKGYVAGIWDYDEQVDRKYRIEFWPKSTTSSRADC